MDDFLIFGGRSSKDFHIHVEKIPTIQVPARRIREEQIPGRNGVLHIDEGAYEPYTQAYEIYFRSPTKTSSDVAHDIKSWLMTGDICRRLEDSYDLHHYHMATFKGPANIENILGEYGRCKIDFICQPEAYAKGEEDLMVTSNPFVIQNRYCMPSTPLIKVNGTSAGSLYVGETILRIKSLSKDQPVYLDSASLTAYSKSGNAFVNQNGNVYAPEYPKLYPGKTNISWDGGIVYLEVKPRWWEL